MLSKLSAEVSIMSCSISFVEMSEVVVSSPSCVSIFSSPEVSFPSVSLRAGSELFPSLPSSTIGSLISSFIISEDLSPCSLFISWTMSALVETSSDIFVSSWSTGDKTSFCFEVWKVSDGYSEIAF